MSFDLTRILESKRSHRRHLAALPIGEKLRMFDAMRERELTLRASRPQSGSLILREDPAPYRIRKA